eukprot:1161715-Pelagomonas_calceolata.AAC.10
MHSRAHSRPCRFCAQRTGREAASHACMCCCPNGNLQDLAHTHSLMPTSLITSKYFFLQWSLWSQSSRCALTLMLALLITSDCEPKPVSDTQLLLSECASPSLLCPFSSSDGCSDPEGDERLLRGEREEGCAGSTASTLGWLGPKLGWEAKLGGSGAVGSLHVGKRMC